MYRFEPLINEETHDIQYWLEHWFNYYKKIDAFRGEFNLMNGDEKILLISKDSETRFLPTCGDEIFKVTHAEYKFLGKYDDAGGLGFHIDLKLCGTVDGITVDALEKQKEYYYPIEFYVSQRDRKLRISFNCLRNINDYEIFPGSKNLDFRNGLARINNSGDPKIKLTYVHSTQLNWYEVDTHNTKLISCVMVAFLRNVLVSYCPADLLSDNGELKEDIFANKYANFGTW